MSKQRRAVLSNEQTSLLIGAVLQRPCIWDSTTQLYKDNVLKKAAWQEIAYETGFSVESLQTRWKSLRDTYSKEQKKNIGKSGQAAVVGKKPWVHFESLTFLNKCVDSLPTTSNWDSDAQLEGVQVFVFNPNDESSQNSENVSTLDLDVEGISQIAVPPHLLESSRTSTPSPVQRTVSPSPSLSSHPSLTRIASPPPLARVLSPLTIIPPPLDSPPVVSTSLASPAVSSPSLTSPSLTSPSLTSPSLASPSLPSQCLNPSALGKPSSATKKRKRFNESADKTDDRILTILERKQENKNVPTKELTPEEHYYLAVAARASKLSIRNRLKLEQVISETMIRMFEEEEAAMI